MMWRAMDRERRDERNRALGISLLIFLSFVLVTQQVLSQGYLYRLDHTIKAFRHHTFRGISSHILLALDDLGLRWVSALSLGLVAIWLAYRFRSWRPINLAVLTVLALNGAVGVSKILFGRTKPRLHVDLLHNQFLGAYPSGHSSNAMLTYGMLAYLLHRYTRAWGLTLWQLEGVVGIITTVVCLVSLIRNTHWFSDLLGGVLLGASILLFFISIDRGWPSKRQPS